MASVKVAVRVRPFNKRETNLKSECVVRMQGDSVTLLPPASSGGTDASNVAIRPHAFTFDYAYYSYDPSALNFVNQETVFKDLGSDVVDNAFKGYNVCVFAYGQTGSGKTYTMMGMEEDRGLIPRICQALFDRMNNNKNSTNYRTEVSYLEIYNEKVKDLLSDPSKKVPNSSGRHNLKVRENPRTGPYVQDLSSHLVLEFEDILSLMQRGNSDRTTASTNMNDTSSRSHAIFTITFAQASFSENGLPSETISKIHLVDLAGSERADATGATGQRLKEGAHINKSLVTLGSVISALAEAPSNNGNKKVFVPYRDSVLTWLLKDSLGGNSQTVMIATISPASVNHNETLSTLRYANRAKNIINKPTVNEDPNVKLIRELREEIERLRKTFVPTTPDPLVATEIAVKEAKERTLTEAWTEKWREAANILSEQRALGLKRTGLGVVLDSEKPHLVGIDEDVLSTGIILYHLKESDTVIGTEDYPGSDIVLRDPSILSKHCVVNLKDGVATLTPEKGALCLVNSSRITNRAVKLSQGCVIVLGNKNVFRYNDPSEVESLRKNMSISAPILNQSLLSESLSDLRSSQSGGLDVKSSSSESDLLKEEDEEVMLTEESDETTVLDNNDVSFDRSEDKILRNAVAHKVNNNCNHNNLNSTTIGGDDTVNFAPGEMRLLPASPIKCDSTSTLSLSSCNSHHNYDEEYMSSNTSGSHLPHSSSNNGSNNSNSHPLTGGGYLSAEEAEMTKLYDKIIEQKEVIMKCLENENIDVDMLNVEISQLQEMQAEYEKLEYEKMRNLWLNSKCLRRGGVEDNDSDDNNMEYEEKLAMLVEQEVDRRLFQEKVLKAASDYHERESLRVECEREVNSLRRQHEREIYILKRKLYESHVAAAAAASSTTISSARNPLVGLNQAYPVIISIPQFRLVTQGNDTYIQYEVKVTFCCELLDKEASPIGTWSVYRRFRMFRDLHVAKSQIYGPPVANINFPPRKIFGSLSETLSETRQKALQSYLNRLIQTCSKIPSCPLSRFGANKPADLIAFDLFFKKDN